MGAGMAGSSSGTSGAGGSGVGGAGGSGMGSGSGGSMGSTSGGSLGSSRPDVDLGSSSNLNRDKTGGSDI
jgi:hypothetical protein